MTHSKRMTCSRLWCTIAVIVGVLILTSVWLKLTHSGRIVGTHVIGGILAPVGIHYDCIQETNARVAEKFMQPLNMNREGVNALNEYWHYAILRECLYRNGYSFLGHAIPAATLIPNEAGTLVYTNPLAGITLEVPADTAIHTSNVLDVSYDYRRYASELIVSTTTVMVETYSSFDEVTSSETLARHLTDILPDGIAVATQEERTREDGTHYSYALLTDSTIVLALYTPLDRIILIHAPNDQEPLLNTLMGSVRFLDTVPSLHS